MKILYATMLLVMPWMMAGCGTASAITPDSNNPIHCMAAFTYGRTVNARAKIPDVALSVESTARALFEGRILKARGVFESSRKEGEDFYAAYGNDWDVMSGLLLNCAKKQDSDPEYRALNKSGALMAAARKVDPLCQANQMCKNYQRR